MGTFTKFSALILILTSVCFQFGCATTANYGARVSSWEGKSSDDLVRTWGQPTATEKLSSGNRMFLYSRLTHEPYAYNETAPTVASAKRQPSSMDLNSPGEIYIKCATYFEVNPQNTIVSVMFRGDECKYKS